MSKSNEAFRTISEAAEELDEPQHVLRFWEGKFGQIRPMKRGGGRRYYRPSDIDVLRGVQILLRRHGYTIKGVQKIFKDHGIKYVGDIGRGAEEEPVPPPTGEDGASIPVAVETKSVSAAPSGDAQRLSAVLGRLKRAKEKLDAALQAGGA